MFLESIKFYEHVEVLLKFTFLMKQLVFFTVFEALRGNLDHDIHEVTSHEYQGMFDIALLEKQLSKLAQ